MTTEKRLVVSPDLFVENESFFMNPPAADKASYPKLSAITWINAVGEHLAEARQQCLQEAVERVLYTCASYQLRLYACHSTWQPDSAVVRHRKLWRSFEARGLALPSGRRQAEYTERGANGLRFFGGVDVPHHELERVSHLMLAERACLLLAAEEVRMPSIAQMLLGGWARSSPRDPDFWRDLAFVTCPQGGILFRPFGEFDDREAGITLIMSRELLKRFRV